MVTEDERLLNEKEEMIRIAKELRYRKNVIDRLEDAKTSNEMQMIMTTARKRLG